MRTRIAPQLWSFSAWARPGAIRLRLASASIHGVTCDAVLALELPGQAPADAGVAIDYRRRD